MSAAVSPEAQRILSTVARVPRGRVASYGQVAAVAGLPGRARLVGWALRHAPEGASLPWHRILRADGRIAFPEGSDGYLRQSRLLARERVAVERGRVDLSRYGWQRAASLDALLWGPAD
ncbi:MAG TPA: MGMT family protein [Candidatus Saccharimonadia bacterium]|nr:MGMT family protein [Candidatus Saccharimonadia bacterium]